MRLVEFTYRAGAAWADSGTSDQVGVCFGHQIMDRTRAGSDAGQEQQREGSFSH